MVCPDCGKELSENALFCKYCGVSVASAETPAAMNEAVDVEEPSVAAQEPSSVTQESNAVTQEPIAVTQEPIAAAQEPNAAADESIIITEVPMPVKKRHVRRAFVSLLLFFIFAGGLAVSGFFIFNVWKEYHTPYQAAAFDALDEQLAKTEDCSEKIAELEALLKSNTRETRELVSDLARYHVQREEEILDTAAASVASDYDALFKTEFFSSAYLQYIDDLLNAFRQDTLTDSWLYSYYSYSADYGANTDINRYLWIYDSHGADEKFSVLLEPRRFCASVYTATLSDHFARNNHLYVTGLDMLNILFQIPGYILDDAVFVKAYGGSPSPAEMEVPGWSPQDYDNFWESADSDSDCPYAFWEDYGLYAEDFNIDWNTLVDENAYYRAYVKFMNAIAPGLERYDMATYTPDDDYYGGVRYELPGKEAALQEIAAAYVAAHPDCLTELGIDTEVLPSSYDSQITDGQLRLEELTKAAEELNKQISEAKRLQNSEGFFRQQQEQLLTMQEQHMEILTRTLRIFALICVFLLVMAFASLGRFIRALR